MSTKQNGLSVGKDLRSNCNLANFEQKINRQDHEVSVCSPTISIIQIYQLIIFELHLLPYINYNRALLH